MALYRDAGESLVEIPVHAACIQGPSDAEASKQPSGTELFPGSNFSGEKQGSDVTNDLKDDKDEHA
ncbi:hypothetical protein PHLCEN_2v4057 [Hermanssonia centrifuga]|uniref:Uncharacterized protein n=1 Tax=Hermanssonia centrifuga TaxID=98765 RepID=A0A2R6Q5F2_9APHY|nr:hypothetical protein PHLCEN_2v4057 [Hermanssonia centrifuga]